MPLLSPSNIPRPTPVPIAPQGTQPQVTGTATIPGTTSIPEATPEVTEPVSKTEKMIQQLIDLWEKRSADSEARSTEYLTKQRNQEYQLLKQTYGLKGDTWETAEGSDTIGNQNLQAFKDRWGKQFEDNSYDAYSYDNIYGGTAGLGMDTFGYDTEETDQMGFLGLGNFQSNSGYLGGLK